MQFERHHHRIWAWIIGACLLLAFLSTAGPLVLLGAAAVGVWFVHRRAPGITTGLARMVRSRPVECALGVLAVIAVALVSKVTGAGLGLSVLLVLGVATVAALAFREQAIGYLRAWRLLGGLRHLGMGRNVVRVGLPRQVNTGTAVAVHLARGREFRDLQRVDGELAAHVGLGVRRIAVRARDDHRGRGDLVMMSRDPFATDDVRPWPWIDADVVDISRGVPFGDSDTGDPVMRNQFTSPPNTFIAGDSGGGKSVAVNQLVAGYLLGGAETYIIDGKDDMDPWERSCHGFARTKDDALAVVRHVHDIIEERRVTKDIARPVLLVIDELPVFSSGGVNTPFNEQLRPVLTRARSLNVSVVSTAQRPTYESVPPSIRDLHFCRFALRCISRITADVALGGVGEEASRDPAQIEALSIRANTPGVGVLRDDRPVPYTLLRTYFLTDQNIEAIAARTRRT